MSEYQQRRDLEEDTLERTKLRFEFFKHLTTLSTAAAVILLTVYREGLFHPEANPLIIIVSLSFTLIGLSISLFVSLYGMLLLISLLDLSLKIPEDRNEAKHLALKLDRMQRMVAGNFGVAVLSFCFWILVGPVPNFLLD